MVCYGIFWSGQLVERLPRKKLTALGEKTVNQTVFTKERIDIRYALVELATDKRFENPFNRCNEDPRKYSLLKEPGGLCCQWNV